MSKGVVEGLEVVGAAVAAYFGFYREAASLLAAALGTDQARRAEDKARAAYNASLRDRYAMIRSSQASRQLVFGRARVSGPIFFGASYGEDRQHLALCIALAAHEVDAIETIYFDDQPIDLDVDGNVTGIRRQDTFSISASTATVTLTDLPVSGSVTAVARYGSTLVTLTIVSVTGVTVSVSGGHSSETGELDVSYKPDPDPYGPTTLTQRGQAFTPTTTTQTFTLSATPLAATVYAILGPSGPSDNGGEPITVTSVSGANVTLIGLTIGRTVVIYYQYPTGATKARVRKYTGAPGQTADAGLIASLPGVWTSAHTATGIAYLVVELDYDQDAFIGGVPNVSAIVRGMKCFDPRTSATAWTENPALHIRALAEHSLAGDLPGTSIDDASIIAAANICDTSTTYTIGDADYVRPLYTSSYAYTVDRKPMDGLTDLCQAMGGGWVFADGALRVSAGAYRTPNPGTMDETWLTDDEAIQVQAGVARAQLVNTVTVSIADQMQDWRVVPLPRLSPSAYIDADGATLAQDLQFAAVSFGGQAQYIASCQLRRARQGLVFKARCNYRAWQAERFDVLNVSLSRFGWTNKPFEVLSDTWTEDGAIELTLQETAAAIWDMDEGFPAFDLAPNTTLPRPWGLPTVTGLDAVSGSTTLFQQSDGTIVPRILVTWDAITDNRILQGGFVEVQYWRGGESSATLQSVKALGTETQAWLTGVQPGSAYVILARTGSNVTLSAWCQQIACTAAGKTTPPSDVSSLAAAETAGAVLITWDMPPDSDYGLTELRRGASWAAGTPLTGSLPTTTKSTTYAWAWPSFGSYTIWAKHRDTSGNYSTTAESVGVTVDEGINVGTGRIVENAATDLYHADHVSTISWASDE